MSRRPQRITDDLVDDIAKRTHRDERSVLRRLVGLPVRGQAGTAIDAELARLGLAPAVSVTKSADDGSNGEEQ